ncbi:sensor histidine kinase [Piscinibacter terrae]|uniref:histidine kinase n=1 Tax=Piscinibacter terrae TaxID=2496871 RepID=A0A3N7HXR6_9BURK|nr:HAMP domain-containing sensor histidine kinase [Albitalea terrae]RQP26703.1 sensor histidine kinase [Albitalea terrae]
MKAAWLPRSLSGRLALVFAAALTIAHLLTLAWWAVGRMDLGRSLMLDYLGPDVAASVAMLDRLPPQERQAWLPKIARPNYRYSLAEVYGMPDNGPTSQRVRAALAQSLGPARVLGVSAELGHESSGARQVSLRLADGSPLTLHMLPLEAGLSRGVVALVLAQLAILAAAAWLGVRLATRPLARLADAADALDPDRPGASLALSGPAEVERAAQAFNAMQQRIAQHLAERAQILAAVSHDLQTPITRLRLRADLLDDGPLREKLHADLAQMQALVEEGIAYARSGHALLERPCRVDLHALLDSVVGDHADAGEPVSFEGEAVPPWTTRPQTLRRLIVNLIDNALKFAGSAEVVLSRDDTDVHITVRDRGPGIPPDQLQAVLQPFHRVEGSRNRDTGGTGLGLAIAQQLAQALDAQLSLRNREGGGLEVQLRLPMPALTAARDRPRPESAPGDPASA